MSGFLAELLLDPSGLVDGVRDWRRERRARRRTRAAMIPGALRVLDGTQRGLSRRWTRGAARVPPGVLVFEADSGPRMTIPVRAATLLPPGGVPRRISRAVGPQPRRIVVETAQASLEWLVPEEQVQRSMGVTRRSVRDGPPPTG